MRWIVNTIARIAGSAAEMTKGIAVLRAAIEGVVMAKVIEFYIPNSFRKPTKWVAVVDRGKIIEFCPQTRKSA
jgi:hypothetical protein